MQDEVNERRYILLRPPPGGAVLHALPVFLCIFPFQIHRQLHKDSAYNANAEILGMKAGKDVLKCQGKIQEKHP